MISMLIPASASASKIVGRHAGVGLHPGADHRDLRDVGLGGEPLRADLGGEPLEHRLGPLKLVLGQRERDVGDAALDVF